MKALQFIKDKQLEKIIDLYGEKIKGINDIKGDEEPTFLFYIMAKKLDYLLENDPEACISEQGVRLRRKIHPIIAKLGPLFLQNPQVFENRNYLKLTPEEIASGVVAKPDKDIVLPEEPVIWIANHGFHDDILATVLAAKRHAYILFGSLPAFYSTIDGFTAYLNGVALVNRKVAASRHSSIDKCERIMELGSDVIIFPEGVWNKSPNELLLNFWPGIYILSKNTGAKVVPICHFLRNYFDRSKENLLHTVVDDPMDICHMPQDEALREVRDVMSGWVYLMMEKYASAKREDIVTNGDATKTWEEELVKRINTAPRYDKEIEITSEYRPKTILREADVWHDLIDEIDRITVDNASAYAYGANKVKQLRRNDFQSRF